MADARLSKAAQQDLEKGFEKIEKEVIGPGRPPQAIRLNFIFCCRTRILFSVPY